MLMIAEKETIKLKKLTGRGAGLVKYRVTLGELSTHWCSVRPGEPRTRYYRIRQGELSTTPVMGASTCLPLKKGFLS